MQVMAPIFLAAAHGVDYVLKSCIFVNDLKNTRSDDNRTNPNMGMMLMVALVWVG